MAAYLALNQNNTIVGGDIDHNSMRYEQNVGNLTQLFYNIKNKHPFVVVKKDEGLYARNQEFKTWLGVSCILSEVIQGGEYLVFKC